jgi:glycosyltransferase involved in cell wall biosynthesis
MEDKKFVLVGEGPTKSKLEKKSPDNVDFKEFYDREKLPELYSAIDVFVTASTCDTLGLSTLEANACGTPVAAADLEPFNQTILEENGSRFEFSNIADMRGSVKDCLENNRDTRKAVKEYSIEKTLDRLEEIYEV